MHLVWKLLHNDSSALRLASPNPFPQKPPRYIRAVLYRYEFVPSGNPTGAWWKREEIGLWLPPFSADDPRVRAFLAKAGWVKTPPSG